MRPFLLILILVITMILSGCFCNSNKKSKPCPADTEQISEQVTEPVVDNNLNVNDFRPAAGALVAEALSETWLGEFIDQNLRNPVLMISSIHNISDDHVSVDILEREISRELLSSGKVRFVALREDRPAPNQEREEELSPSQAMALASGADFAMKGVLSRVGNTGENVRSKLYLVEISLVHLGTGKLVHQGSYTIQKQIHR